MHQHIGRPLALAIDATGVAVIAGTLAGYIPDIAALFAAAWYATQIWESKLGRRIGHWIRARFQ